MMGRSASTSLIRLLVTIVLGTVLGAGLSSAGSHSSDGQSAAFSDTGALHPDEYPEEEREYLRLGFSEFSAGAVPGEYRYLARSLPLVLVESLADIPERRRSPEELRAAAEEALDRLESETVSRIADLVDERDELLFTETGEEREQERSRINEELASLRDLLAAVRATEAVSVAETLSDRLPLEVVRESEEQPLFVDGEPLEEARRHELDLLLGGRMRYDDGYLFVEFELAVAATGEIQTTASTLVRPEDAFDEIEPLLPRITASLLNRDFAVLTIETDEPRAAISLDGSVFGFGSVRLRYLEPGTYELRAGAAGYRDYTDDIEIDASEERKITIELDPVERTEVTVDSDPPGAELYVGGEWRGRTPLTIERPIGPRSAELRLEDHAASRFVLEPRGPDRISRVLAPDTVDLSTELRDRREGFYRSLGWFAVSVPVPLILSGIWQNRVDYLVDNQAAMSVDEQERFIRTTNTIDLVRWGGVAVSGGLLVNSVIQLVRYIRASQYYHFD